MGLQITMFPTFYGFLMSVLTFYVFLSSQFLDETFGSLFHLLKCSQDCDTKVTLYDDRGVNIFVTYSRQACWIACKIPPLISTNLPKHSASVKQCYKQFYSIMMKRCCCCCCCFVFGFVLLFRLFHPFFPMLSFSDAST